MRLLLPVFSCTYVCAVHCVLSALEENMRILGNTGAQIIRVDPGGKVVTLIGGYVVDLSGPT